MSEELAPVQQQPAVQELPIQFRATGGEYFRIWIVNLLLTILTLGIYSAWAKVRRLRYFYGSTSLAGSSFEYHANPVAILKGRLIIVAVYGIFLALTYVWPVAQVLILPLVFFGLPWVVVRARLFQMRMTSWRGLRFNFHGRYGGAFGAYIGWTLAAMVTLMALWPFALWKQVRYLLSNTSFGSRPFEFHTRAGVFYRIFLVCLALVVGLGICAVVLMFLAGGAASVFGAANEQNRVVFGGLFAFLLVGVMMLGGLAIGAYYRSRFLNASVGGVTVGPHQVNSRIDATGLAVVLFTNLLGMVVTLGLFYPWAQVRLLRYQLERTSVTAVGDIGDFVADAQVGANALGEEAGDFFDVDFGI